MIRRAIWISLLCAALVGALFISPLVIRADSVTVTFDSGGWADYTITYGSLVSGGNPGDMLDGGGGSTGTCGDFPSTYSVSTIRITLPEPHHVTSYSLDHKTGQNGGHYGSVVSFYDSDNDQLSIDSQDYLGSTAWATFTGSVDVSGVKYITIQVSACGVASYRVYLDNAGITWNIPTATPTPTGTATLPPIGVPYPACTLLGDNALIGDAWDISQASRPSGQTHGAIIPAGKFITLPNVQINPTHKYQILTYWQANTVPDPRSSFNIWIGEHEKFNDFIVSMPEDTAEHSHTIPPVNLYPDAAKKFDLVVSVPTLSTDPQTQLNYICVEDLSASGGKGGSTASSVSAGVCAACNYQPVGDLFRDIPALLGWIWCGIRRLVECVLLGIFSGIWNGIAGILRAIASFIAWIIQVMVGIYDFFTGSGTALTRWGGGYLNNIGATISNTAGPWGRETVNGINGLANNVPIALGNEIASISGYITSIFNTGEGLLGMIGGLFTLTLHAIGFLIFIVPILIGSLVSGFMSAAAGVPPSVVSCAISGSTFYPVCMGFYILDNTIFSGPAFYLLPLVEGALAWDTVTWAFYKFRETFSK